MPKDVTVCNKRSYNAHLCKDILYNRVIINQPGKYCMTDAIRTYQFMRTQQQLRPIDACTDAAQYHGVKVAALAAALIALGIDAARLSLI
jgi:hypothetical protein